MLLVLCRLELDPAVSTAVFVTTLTDVVGLFIFPWPGEGTDRSYSVGSRNIRPSEVWGGSTYQQSMAAMWARTGP